MSDKKQLIALVTPFPEKYVERVPGAFGDFIGHGIITQRLLRVLGPFDYRVTQVFESPDGILEGCLAELTVAIDGRIVTVTEAGECDNPLQKKTQGDRLKNASSDAIKRCAMRLGCGLQVWAQEHYFIYDQLKAQAPEDAHPFDAPGPRLYEPDDPSRPFEGVPLGYTAPPPQTETLPLDEKAPV